MTEQNNQEQVAPKRPSITNQDTLEKMETLKSKLGLKTDTDLVSVALSLLNMCVELQEKGYEIAGLKEKGLFGEREIRTIAINMIR